MYLGNRPGLPYIPPSELNSSILARGERLFLYHIVILSMPLPIAALVGAAAGVAESRSIDFQILKRSTWSVDSMDHMDMVQL